ncbi:MAG: PAS:Response regulator receiver:ATP-binding region ATPase-like:Histidine kinase A-like protein [Ignavibacteria bacterium]|nr:MAG: PAS:Response regulator receiver:ATP-binding region ATPase-like:Histidine kinase A-like protein [Ignavibacteria bacterium]KAF0161635.1 MAG: PAS:Response regulator receiver:ATP-binding region ATPase-like:Histidine kinase A-like protein [Ignavibacteria bacterium]
MKKISSNSIITKIIIVHLCVSFSFFVGSYLMWKNQEMQLIDISLEARKRTNSKLKNSLELLSQQFISYIYDYSYWDDMVAFVKKPKAKWAAVNLDGTLSHFNVSFVLVLDQKLKLVYTSNSKKYPAKENFPLSEEITNHIFSNNKFPHFFFHTGTTLIEIAGAPIQYSTDSNRVGSPQGYLLSARVWDENYLRIIEKQIQSKVFFVSNSKFKAIQKQYDVTKSPENIFANLPLNDHNGNIIYNLYSINTDSAISEIKEAYNRYAPIWFIVGTFVLIFLLGLFNKWVFRPIRILSKSLISNETVPLISLSQERNVFGDFARLLLEFYKQKKSFEIEIGKRKQVEKELLIKSSAIEQSPLSILISNTAGIIEYVNPKFIEVSGYSENDIVRQKSLEYIFEFYKNEFYKNIWLTIKTGQNWSGEIYSKKQNGVTYWENVLISSIKDEEGNIIHFLVLKEDVTEKKNILKELILAKEKAEESSRIKDAFFNNMSHELRTPMIGILGFAEMIIEEDKDEATIEKAKIIHKSGKRLLDTLNKVLDLSKAKSDFERTFIAPLNISEIAQDSFKLFEQTAIQKEINYTFTNEDNMDYFVMSDSYMLNSIFNNLLNNAIKFTRAGNISINITGTNEEVFVGFKDTGIGIPQESLSLIFEEFRQVSEGIGRSFEGTGLGLALTKKYVELLGGSIGVESVIGKGSLFTVTFPVVKKEKRCFKVS